MSESILLRIARGDAGAVAECIDAFGPLVWAMARRRSPDRAEAEDAVQEIFTDVWRSAARFDPERGSDRLFVAMIARRRLIDRARRRALAPAFAPVDEVAELDFADPGIAGEQGSEAALAAQAVRTLSPEQQRVLALAIVDGLTHEEIATRTGLPLGTVKTQLRRGLIRVREALGLAPGRRENPS